MTLEIAHPARVASDLSHMAGNAIQSKTLRQYKLARQLIKVFRANFSVAAAYSAGAANELGLAQKAKLETMLLYALADKISDTKQEVEVDRTSLRVTVPADVFRNLNENDRKSASDLRNLVDEIEARRAVQSILPDIAAGEFTKFGPITAEDHSASFWPRQFITEEGATREQVVTTMLREILTSYPNTEQLIAGVDLDRVLAIGSCFARNLAYRLDERGFKGASMLLPEAVNSPRAVLGLLTYLVDGDSEITGFVESTMTRKDITKLKDGLKNASCIVATVGVAVLTLVKATGKLYLGENVLAKIRTGELEQRLATVSEIRENLDGVMSCLRRLNPGAKIIVTESPVPLTGVSKTVGHVVEVDFRSKATIKLALDSFMRDADPSVFGYWPSFEVIKWLAPHVPATLNYTVFGGDDNNSRHIGAWVVREIVDYFIDTAQRTAGGET